MSKRLICEDGKFRWVEDGEESPPPKRKPKSKSKTREEPEASGFDRQAPEPEEGSE